MVDLTPRVTAQLADSSFQRRRNCSTDAGRQEHTRREAGPQSQESRCSSARSSGYRSRARDAIPRGDHHSKEPSGMNDTIAPLPQLSPLPTSAAELERRRAANAELIELARPHLEWLSVAHQGIAHVVSLVDRDGVVLLSVAKQL